MKHTFTLLCFLSFFLSGSIEVKAQAVDKTDSLALIDLYNATKGSSWTNGDNWLTASPLCSWHGITVSCHRVVGIDLGVNNLSGKLPSSLGNLSGLQSLYLYNNKLRGSLPASLFKLENLKELLLGNNSFSGALPSAVGKLKNLLQLDLSNNRLSQSIPFAIGSLVNAEYINLNNNDLTGRIPITVGKLAGVRILEMAGNRLSGPIPTEIGNLGALQYLYLQENQFSGLLPSSIGRLQNLQVFYADHNSLSGPLTNAIGNAANLQLLSLSDNQLTGAIPSSVGNLSRLAYLYLNNNELRGTLPSSILKLTGLQYLYLDHNHLSQGTDKHPVLPLNVYLHADISHNNFTFDGMEFVATHYPFITYAPQAIIPIHKNGESISLHAGGTLSNNSYTWYKKEDMSLVAVQGDSSFRPVAGGHYFAQVRNAVATQLVLSTDTFEYTETSETNQLISSVSSVRNANNFLVYPNPARDIVHIRTAGNTVITLTDGNGKLLLSKTVGGTDRIDVSRLAAGTYYLQNKTTGETKKLSVVH